VQKKANLKNLFFPFLTPRLLRKNPSQFKTLLMNLAQERHKNNNA